MTYIQFREALHDFAVFSINDIAKLFPAFDARRLVEWQQKGYLQKLINKWYLFKDISLDERLRFRIANCLCRPSYISLESAFSYYGFIPEGVYVIQSISTRKTVLYETKTGNFQYRNLKPNLFFGYQAERSGDLPVLIAEPEKALLDFLYLNPRMNSLADIEGMRFNFPAFMHIINWELFDKYAACFESATLIKRVNLLKKTKVYADTI